MRFLKRWRNEDDEAEGSTIEQLRAFVKKNKRAVRFSLFPYDGRWALRYHIFWIGSSLRGWMLSEKSRKVRTFAKTEAAFKVARSFGQPYIKVDLENMEQLP